MPSTRFSNGDAVNEGSDAEYQCQFKEAAAGQPVLNAAAILTITATLRDVKTDAILGSRNAQNVKGVNGGTLAVDGTFTLHFTGNTDMVVAGAGEQNTFELHSLTLKVTYTKTGGGTGYLNHVVEFFVQRIEDVA